METLILESVIRQLETCKKELKTLGHPALSMQLSAIKQKVELLQKDERQKAV